MGPHQPTVFVTVLLIGCTLVSGLHTGAPEQACSDMVPAGHGVAAQTGKSPYRILLPASLEIKNGQPLTITLTAPTIGPPFKGFFIQMRTKGGNEPVGTFNPDSDPKLAQPVNCGGKQNSAMTHKDNNPKVQVSLQWTPPPGDGEYVPVVTFVKQQDTFWVQEKPDEKTIKVSGSGGGGSPSGAGQQLQPPNSSGNSNNNETGQGAAGTNLPLFALVTLITFVAMTLLR